MLDTKPIVPKAAELLSVQPKRVLVQHMLTRLQELVSALLILFITSTLVPLTLFICLKLFDIYLATCTGNDNGGIISINGCVGCSIFFLIIRVPMRQPENFQNSMETLLIIMINICHVR